jgi:hypothetical protein
MLAKQITFVDFFIFPPLLHAKAGGPDKKLTCHFSPLRRFAILCITELAKRQYIHIDRRQGYPVTRQLHEDPYRILRNGEPAVLGSYSGPPTHP